MHSPVVFGNDYYPFGMPMAGRQITRENHRYGYQSLSRHSGRQYAEQDSLTGWNMFELRMYDARFGRWLSPDPYGQYASPYNGMGNMPHAGVDPDGGFNLGATFAGAALGFGIGAAAGLIFDKDNWWKYAIGGAAIGGAFGASTGDINYPDNVGFGRGDISPMNKFTAEIDVFFSGKNRIRVMKKSNGGFHSFNFGPGSTTRKTAKTIKWLLVDNSGIPTGVIRGLDSRRKHSLEIKSKVPIGAVITDQNGENVLGGSNRLQFDDPASSYRTGPVYLDNPVTAKRDLPDKTAQVFVELKEPLFLDNNGQQQTHGVLPHARIRMSMRYLASKSNVNYSSKFSKQFISIKVISSHTVYNRGFILGGF